MSISRRAVVGTLCLVGGVYFLGCGGGELETNVSNLPGVGGNGVSTGGSAQGGSAGKSSAGTGGAIGKGGTGGASGANGGVGAGGTAGGGGKAGNGGTAGASGASGKAGNGAAGNGGTAGKAGAGGKAGTSGAGGKAGNGGSGGGNAVCGDGVKNGIEKCDKLDLGGATCSTVLNTPATGPLGCFGNCSFDTSQCMLGAGGAGGVGGNAGTSGAGGAGPVCGDGVKAGIEQCDKADLGAATCASVLADPGATGMVACFANCTLDSSGCTPTMTGTGGAAGGTGGTGVGGVPGWTCGDNVKDGTEPCDGTDVGLATCATAVGDPASTGTLACFQNCTLDLTGCSTPSSVTGAKCGDGVKNGSEQCDGSSFGNATCASAVGLGSIGILKCFANCTIDESMCTLPTGAGGAGGAAGASGAGGAAGAAGAPQCKAGDLPCPPGATCLGNTGCCTPVTCGTHTYACGNCLDDDGDGLVDQADPDCLGPCSNGEGPTLATMIPGAGNAPCKQDCFFDQDSGSGNDGCYWDHACDPHEKAPSYSPENSSCAYNPNTKFPMGLGTCADLLANQPAQCKAYCPPITPNGCDCFGCCDLPGGSGNFVYLGSTADGSPGGTPTCTLADVNDPTKCHPCLPVQGACYKPCLHCDLCLGKTTLPADCLPPPIVCGDGKKAGLEQCDGTDLGMPAPTCASYTGNPASTGTITCAANCTLDGSQCTTPMPSCGDGFKEGLEQCDGTDLGNPAQTCASYTGQPSATGMLFCNSNCTLDGSMCVIPQQPPGTGGSGGGTSCGDNVKNGTEQCDGADLAGATCPIVLGNPKACGTLSCNPNCTLNASGCTLACGMGGAGGSGPSCGDGIIDQPTEQCDGMDLGGATCVSATGNPLETGTLTCFPNCTLDTAGCIPPGTGGSGGSCGGQLCASGAQPCGLPCQPACPTGQYCNTGCCAGKP